ncbi:MAG: hypothetical protein NTY19_16670, partial [Planctomycetota bacterium]|nr:hypothetical protein [Planctomycetota bacterium]
VVGTKMRNFKDMGQSFKQISVLAAFGQRGRRVSPPQKLKFERLTLANVSAQFCAAQVGGEGREIGASGFKCMVLFSFRPYPGLPRWSEVSGLRHGSATAALLPPPPAALGFTVDTRKRVSSFGSNGDTQRCRFELLVA